jgi:hypothetical protein
MKLTNGQQDPEHDLNLRACRLQPLSAGPPQDMHACCTLGIVVDPYSQLVQVLKSATEHGGGAGQEERVVVELAGCAFSGPA